MSKKPYKPLQIVSREELVMLKNIVHRVDPPINPDNEKPKKKWRFDKDVFFAQLLDASIFAGVVALASGGDVAITLKSFLGTLLLKLKEYRRVE